jgi:hypothetical protein
MPSLEDGPVGAIIQPEIPRRGMQHPQVQWAYVNDISAVPDDEDEFAFLVTVRYTTIAASGIAPEENPLLRPYKISVTDTTTQEEVAKDLDEKAVVNSSREPLFGAIRDVTNHVLTITRNEPFFPWADLKRYRNTINASTFYDGDPRTWRLLSITGDLAFESGIFFAQVSYRFEHEPMGWNRKIMDRGTRKIITTYTGPDPEKKYKTLTDGDGRQFQGFFLLNGHGQPLPETEDPVFLPLKGPPWRFYEELSFGPLNLE